MTRDSISDFYETYPYPHVQYFSRERMKTYAKPLLAAGNITLEELNGKTVLDVGCGTGEIACSLATHAEKVIGIDASKNSITLARKKAAEFGFKNILFEQNDLFAFQPEKKVDVVTAFGVLHHTRNAEKGFDHLATMVKKDGIFFHGFYHSWGGWKQRAQKVLARTLGGKTPAQRMRWVESFQGKKLNESEKAYWMDRIANPREQYYRVPHVVRWFEKNGFEIIGIQSHKPAWRVKNVKSALDILRFEMEIGLRGKRFVIIAGKKK